MKKLYAPWRSKYTTSTARTKNEKTKKSECAFCTQIKEKKDTKNFIIKRTKNCIVMLNLYPYNAGHLLVLPVSHTASLDKLSENERAELMELVSESSSVVTKALKAEGVNIGLNLGKAAGAGIPSHLHFHVLPRWIGDTNYLPALADTKQISFDLKDIYTKLKKGFSHV